MEQTTQQRWSDALCIQNRDTRIAEQSSELVRLQGINRELLATLQQIERLSQTADGSMVNVALMLGDIARKAIAAA